jgi:hypothetical protein
MTSRKATIATMRLGTNLLVRGVLAGLHAARAAWFEGYAAGLRWRAMEAAMCCRPWDAAPLATDALRCDKLAARSRYRSYACTVRMRTADTFEIVEPAHRGPVLDVSDLAMDDLEAADLCLEAAL